MKNLGYKGLFDKSYQKNINEGKIIKKNKK